MKSRLQRLRPLTFKWLRMIAAVFVLLQWFFALWWLAWMMQEHGPGFLVPDSGMVLVDWTGAVVFTLWTVGILVVPLFVGLAVVFGWNRDTSERVRRAAFGFAAMTFLAYAWIAVRPGDLENPYGVIVVLLALGAIYSLPSLFIAIARSPEVTNSGGDQQKMGGPSGDEHAIL